MPYRSDFVSRGCRVAEMTDAPKTRSSIVAITEAMVKGGLAILEELTSEGVDAADSTDSQLVIAIFTRMWQVKLKEEGAIRRGIAPSNVIQMKPKKLIIPWAIK